ncbi:MAG: D-glycerate dehydrogenase [bacterium]|uniref:D-isomer specific 2-hydroxyacid dehydrogenase, catalytic component n=2 Tax=Bacteria candidate phyla TaxID=1783234 RepID=A0A117M6X3_UNCT6|nr:MAG: D-isomer specific 2-hydroxyacid dehydrogenase, catalytic component [candidate division TA06 bacterium 32_111]KUK87669.1 MAG: D-isomer specific 2-hydroxyacid dehydrogenase, catalytic component [candidate division TA06 bacterium 34_109]MDI6699803.1 D-glycerate dehydrogenase [bacterium]HAF07508.1 D-glycerate dehydrogenase [candidate division WOR-3 bacterium]HCP17577.1 D-glycerate dehydrogenase [candidate division WOR-3 bacterium]
MKVLQTYSLPFDTKRYLNENGIEVDIFETGISYEEILQIVEKYDGIISLLSNRIDRNILEKGKNLKVVANYAVGYDNIDTSYAKEKNIFVTNTPDVLTEATADVAFALLLSVTRRIVESDEFVRKGEFKGWKPDLLLGKDLFGKTLGIYGFGRIGKAVARRAKGFGMDIIFTDENVKDETLARKVDFEKLIKQSDFISINAPLNETTLYRFDIEVFKKMKKNVIIINTARGKIIKEKDLVYALKNNIISGAGLDVYENEPLIEEELLKMKNVVLLPHIGSATEETREKMAKICVRSVVEVLIEKRRPEKCVNF